MNRKNLPIAISGISGRFPRARNMKEFAGNLYNKVDMIDDDESRWKHFNPSIPRRFGKISGLEKFDASFFSYLDKHAAITDPQTRMLLEHSYEAILDAGVSPQSLFGSNTGVFVACMMLDSKDAFLYNVPSKDSQGGSFVSNSLFNISNRISYVLGLSGPSISIDTACSGSIYALDLARKAIESGECDAALVAGTNLILNQKGIAEFVRAGPVSLIGESRPFDANATGYVRAETVCVIFLQKRETSKRVYAEIIHTKTNNDGYKEEGSSFPSSKMQRHLMEKFYADINFDPTQVQYVEAHSTGTQAGDLQEVNAVDEVFSKKRSQENPLLIGSLKSNMGHAESAAGVASIAKILISFENQQLPPNINLVNIRTDVEAFREERIKVVTEVLDFEGEYIAMNSFGLGGANAHVLLKRNSRKKVLQGIPRDNLPRLVLWSGRTEDAVNAVFDDIIQRPLDAEHVTLLQISQKQTSLSNNFRGFGMFNHDDLTNKAEYIQTDIQVLNRSRRPVVWVFTGMGSQWLGMVSDLMKIPTFAMSIEKSHDFLLSKSVNLKEVLTSNDKAVFDNVLNSYVGIVAIEIALTDVLKSLELSPDFMIGHSVGELGCAYADGCFTAEETILIAYLRGLVGTQTNSIKGAMAAIGLHHTLVKNILPEDIDIACHNGNDSTTISGPAESVEAFVVKMTNEKIFAKNVVSSGVAFHSRYIVEMGEKFNDHLQSIIKKPKERSSKWLSSTYPKSSWSDVECQLSSADYHTKNLLNPVLFEEVCKMLPADSLTIEIGPHGLLQSILKQNIKDGLNFSLMQRGNQNGSSFLMETLGKIFMSGLDMDISKLYPSVEFPVSRGTPMISPVLKWNHDEDHFVAYLDTFSQNARRNMIINLSDKSFEFMKGHVVGGSTLFPGAGWIYYVWETFALMQGKPLEKLKVIFDDVKFERATTLIENHDVIVTIAIHIGSGKFEVTEGQSIICEGSIRADDDLELSDIVVPDAGDDQWILSEDDLYKIFSLEGFQYRGDFRHTGEMRADGMQGKLKWQGNWITFIDGLLANRSLFSKKSNGIPTKIRRILIDPKIHFELLKTSEPEENTTLEIIVSEYSNIVRAGGVEFHEVQNMTLNKRRVRPATLETYKFVPYFPVQNFSIKEAIKIILQLICENNCKKKLTIIEVASDNQHELMAPIIVETSQSQLQMPVEVTVLNAEKDETINEVEFGDGDLAQYEDIDLIIKDDAFSNQNFLDSTKSILNKNGFILSIESTTEVPSNSNFIAVLKFKVGDDIFNLLRLRTNLCFNTAVIKISQNIDEWNGPLKVNSNVGSTIALAEPDGDASGIVGLVNCIRKEPFGEELKCVCIKDRQSLPFDVENEFYKHQLNNNFAMNVLKGGEWGSYRYLDLSQNTEMKPTKSHYFVDCIVKGDLSTLSWIRGPLSVSDTDALIYITFASLNFKDIMISTGRITPGEFQKNQYSGIGSEFSGVTHDGRRVMGINRFSGVMSTHCRNSDLLLWNVPDNWTLEEAATVPLVYFTVYFAFFHESKITKGKSILIHAGSGGVGQAAIQVALAYGLTVFTTVSKQEKKEYLMKKFSLLREENIANSRNADFEKMIMERTKGEGVDFVLNSLSKELLQASIRCLKTFGTFLEIGQFDIQNRTNIHMGHLAKRINFKAVIFLDSQTKPEDVKFVHNLMDQDLKLGVIKPIKSTVFDASEIQNAFRFMANGKHIGKVLLRIRQNENERQTLAIHAISRIYCDDAETFIIVGGLGGFGIELADWLVSRGCRKLVLSSRSGVKNGYQQYRIRHWSLRGVQVVISNRDVATKSGCEEMIEDAMKLGPVGGIFNLAVVLRDRIFENQTTETFKECLKPKADVTKQLDEISKLKCPDLKHFVVFSSVACGRGNAGQSNYGMANSIMEEIVEKRHQEGLPAKAIQWGAIGDVGLLENSNDQEVEISGTLAQEIASCLDVLDRLLTGDDPIVSSMVIAKNNATKRKKLNLLSVISNILLVDKDKLLTMETPLGKLGIDSLTTVEIQQVLERDYETSISSGLLRNLTIRQIQERIDSYTSDDAMMYDVSIVSDVDVLRRIFGDDSMIDKVIVKANDVEGSKLPIALIVPGIIGSAADAYYDLARNLKYPTFILAFHTTADCLDFEVMVEMIKDDALELFAGQKNFILISQSFGSSICLRIAALLEANGKVGHVISIDGSPSWSFQLVKQIQNGNIIAREHIEDWTLKFFIKIALMGEAKDVMKQVFLKNTWDSKIDALYEFVKTRFSFSFKFLKKYVMNAIVSRVQMIMSFDKIEFPILKQSAIVLLRASETSVKNYNEDYDLDKQSLLPLTNRVLEGSHMTIIGNPELPKIVNDFY